MVVVVYQMSNLAPIALIPEAMFLGQIYSISESETQSFRYFLEISLSSSLLSLQHVVRNNNELQLYNDYQALNSIMAQY